MSKRIILSGEVGDYNSSKLKAELEGNPEVFSEGHLYIYVIGDLIYRFPEQFDITIKDEVVRVDKEKP